MASATSPQSNGEFVFLPLCKTSPCVPPSLLIVFCAAGIESATQVTTILNTYTHKHTHLQNTIFIFQRTNNNHTLLVCIDIFTWDKIHFAHARDFSFIYLFFISFFLSLLSPSFRQKKQTLHNFSQTSVKVLPLFLYDVLSCRVTVNLRCIRECSLITATH